MSTMKVPYLNFPAQFEESRTETMQAMQRVFERGDFILGEDVELFEKEFAKLCGVKHAIGVGNGTDSLIIAMKALGISSGDEVITAPNSFVSSASSIALIGAKPVFADVTADQNISPREIEKAITPRTKAIMPVHLTGRCADMKAIRELAKKYGLPIIEDAAQSVGASIDGLMSGGAGLVGSFSLHPLKNLNAAGDAGVLTTDDDALTAKLRLYRHHGLKNRDEVVFWGYNTRLDTIQAALLRLRLARLPTVVEKRRANAAKYSQGLKGLVQCPVEKPNERHTYHVFVIQCDHRDELQDYLLNKRGVDTKIHYPIPIHLQEAARGLDYRRGSFPVAEKQAGRILSLPIHQYLTDDEISWVIESIHSFFG